MSTGKSPEDAARELRESLREHGHPPLVPAPGLIGQDQQALREKAAYAEHMDFLRHFFQDGIVDINKLAGDNSELTAVFTVDAAAYYRVTPYQRALLMEVSPPNIRALNAATPDGGFLPQAEIDRYLGHHGQIIPPLEVHVEDSQRAHDTAAWAGLPPLSQAEQDQADFGEMLAGLPPIQPPVRKPQPVLSELTLDAVQAEATRAHVKHGDQSMLGSAHTDEARFAILAEEGGEAADEALAIALDMLAAAGMLSSRIGRIAWELNETRLGHRADRAALVKELIQTAAMALTWVEALEGEL